MRRLPTLITASGGILALTILALWMGGVFATGVVQPGQLPPPAGGPIPAKIMTITASRQAVWYEAVGTVRPVTEATLAAQIPGRVRAVHVSEGDRITARQLLVELDDEEFRTRVAQAKSARAAADAAVIAADKAYERVERLHAAKAATDENLEAALARRDQARAGAAAAGEKVREAETVLGYTSLLSPLDGIVSTRLTEPGDLAWPGKPLVTVYDPNCLRLEADIREGLIGTVATGTPVTVRLTVLQDDIQATIQEIVPTADPVSRSFRVKVSLPVKTGLHAGMFGKLRIRTGERDTVLIPDAAVRRVGQLTTVRVRGGDDWTTRTIILGSAEGDLQEILSGLAPGDVIGWDA